MSGESCEIHTVNSARIESLDSSVADEDHDIVGFQSIGSERSLELNNSIQVP